MGQDGCDLLKDLIAADNRDQFTVKQVERYDLVHYRNNTFIPETSTTQIVDWYHEFLVHPDKSRLEVTDSTGALLVATST